MAEASSLAIGAGSGALAGASLGPAGIAGGAAIGLAGAYFGGKQQEKAARQAAERQQQLADQASKISAPSFAELQSVQNLIQQRDQFLQIQRAQITSQRDKLQQADEITKEQGRQVYALLRGEDDKYSSVANKDIAKQKAQFEDQMQRRLGPGWRTSSAGLEASMRFEDQAQRYLLNARDQGIGNYLKLSGVASTELQGLSSLLDMGTNANLGVINAETAIKGREIGALTGQLNASNAQGNVGIMAGQNTQNLFTTLGNVASQLGGYYMDRNKTAENRAFIADQNKQLINALSPQQQPQQEPTLQAAVGQIGQINDISRNTGNAWFTGDVNSTQSDFSGFGMKEKGR